MWCILRNYLNGVLRYKKYKIYICEWNLGSEWQKPHIWRVWVASLLGQNISDVQYVMLDRIEVLSMGNGQNVNNSGQGRTNEKYWLWTYEFTSVCPFVFLTIRSFDFSIFYMKPKGTKVMFLDFGRKIPFWQFLVQIWTFAHFSQMLHFRLARCSLWKLHYGPLL